MRAFELTERGKILVAVVLVLLFLVLTAGILVFMAMASPSTDQPISDQSPQESLPSPDDTASSPIAIPPPPDDDGLDPPVVTPPDNGGSHTPRPNGVGPPVVDSTEGTLSFFFSTEFQSGLDQEIMSMLDIFLGSPENTHDKMIAIETPKLSEEDTGTFITVITDALGELGIEAQHLAHIVDPNLPLDVYFEVNLYYITHRPK